MSKIINSIDVQQFCLGWWGEHNEGRDLLDELGLVNDIIPFNIEQFLQRLTTSFKDADGEAVSVCLKKHDTHFEFGCIYRGKRRAIRLYREWQGESLDSIIQLESYSIGECVRQIIVGKSIV